MLNFLHSNWFTNTVLALAFLWSGWGLVRAIATGEGREVTKRAVITACPGLLLCMPLTFYFVPALAPPKPWRPSNIWYLLRWPGIVFLIDTCLLFYVYILDRRPKHKAA